MPIGNQIVIEFKNTLQLALTKVLLFYSKLILYMLVNMVMIFVCDIVPVFYIKCTKLMLCCLQQTRTIQAK